MKKLALGILTLASLNAAANEECWSAKPILKSLEESKKLNDEHQLCTLNFYSGEYSICPKFNSTFPGVLVIKRLSAITDAQVENKCVKIDELKANKEVKVIAKFKQTTSCSHASSPVTYYRVAEFLNASRVPVAVFRTMNKESHFDLTKKANTVLAGDSNLISQTWKRFLTMHANPSQHPEVFRDGQVFGALSENINGEFKYTEMAGVGSYDSGYQRFMQQKPFLAVASEKSVVQLAEGNSLKKMAQVVTVMKDVSNMIVMDYLLNQADRIGNIHFKFKLYNFEDGVLVEKKSNAELKSGKIVIPQDEKESIAAGAVLVRETVLKDNDCGISKENKMKKHGILNLMRHMNAKVYRQVQKLANFVNTAEGQQYFKDELQIPTEIFNGSSKYQGIKNNILQAAKILKENCESGKLKLDLNLEKLMADENYRESCATEKVN